MTNHIQNIYAALDALKNNQRQLDMDGCEVGVSRQALEEVIAALEAEPTEPHHTTMINVEGPSVGLKPIPIEAAKRIAREYGYDQVLIYARRCHDTPEPHGEHITTYGRNREHCDVAAMIGNTLKKFMGWDV